MENVKLTPMGYQQLSASDLGSSVGLTVPAGANVAIFNPETADVRWRDDFGAPTASVGMLIVHDTYYQYMGNLTSIRFIKVSGSPLLNVSYYKTAG